MREPLAIYKRTVAAIAGAATYNPGQFNLTGYKRVVGMWHLPAGGAGAAGFPRIVQSVDGTNADITTIIAVDGTQAPEIVYPFDLTLTLPYVSFEFTNSGAASSLTAEATAFKD